MRFKSILLALAAVGAAAVGEAYAQRVVTPFTPRVVDSTGKKVYVQPQKIRRSRLAVTFGYGYSPITANSSYANKRFPFVENNSPTVVDPPSKVTGCFGTVSLGINYEITPWLELNVPFVYSHSKGWQPCVRGSEDISGGQKDDWFTLLPNLRINWVRNNWLSVYTRAGIGFGVGNRWVSIDQDQTVKAIFGWHVSPVGVEMGKGNFCFFVEGGYGFTGAVTAGIKLKVGKMQKNGRVSTGRKVDWYEKYLR